MLVLVLTASAQSVYDEIVRKTHSFVDLSRQQMGIDTLLPEMTHIYALPKNYKDSTYTVRILYPEFKPLTRKERKQYVAITGTENAPAMPEVSYTDFVITKKPILRATLTPIVMHDGKLCWLSSYLPRLTAVPTVETIEKSNALANSIQSLAMLPQITEEGSDTYAANSVLRSGTWAKISVPSTGIYQLTEDVIKAAGFSDLSKVKIFGYGGAIIPEKLTQAYLKAHDDLPQVPTCTVDGKVLFYGVGPVTWESSTVTNRTRNHYSDYGYYFITDNASFDAKTCTWDELVANISSGTDIYHQLWESDDYAWSQFGNELVSNDVLSTTTKTYPFTIPAGNTSVKVQAIVSSSAACTVVLGAENFATSRTSSIYIPSEHVANGATMLITLDDIQQYGKVDENGNITINVTLQATSGSARLDNITLTYSTPSALPKSSDTFPAATYVYNIYNQNHHADEVCDMIIIIPTSQKLMEPAKALGEMHKTLDGLTYRIVPADELYNEFSSGTPDATAYRRYLKMYYDKDDNKRPKYLLLFGASLWDNRIKTLSSTAYNADDYLLCYSTDNSYSKIAGTATDDYFTVLADNTTLRNSTYNSTPDIAVGRIPTSNVTVANGVVNKIKHYAETPARGDWQNTLVFIGDDGADDDTNPNIHMRDVDACAEDVIGRQLGFNVKKVLLGSYARTSTSNGFRFPEVTNMLINQQNAGALVMYYAGHASYNNLSNANLLTRTDFASFKGTNYSMWIAAACGTEPFDGTSDNIGINTLLNLNGGSIAFYGAVREVYPSQNAALNRAMMKYLFRRDGNGKIMPIGLAQQNAKTEMSTGIESETGARVTTDLSVNKHQYNLLGDPALRLAAPVYKAVIDSINDVALKDATDPVTVRALEMALLKGHIEDAYGEKVTSFTGTANLLIKDGTKDVVCKNYHDAASAFVYNDRDVLYEDNGKVTEGNFSLSFVLPKNILNSDETGLIAVYAKDTSGAFATHGETDNVLFNGWAEVNDELGPSLDCYLNTPSFRNGDTVGPTPLFVANIYDKNRINKASSLGHNMELIVDNKATQTYNLNDYFVFDDSTSVNINDRKTRGTARFVIPHLTQGYHYLTFRAWDIVNNSSTIRLDFYVNNQTEPNIYDIKVTPNPVKEGNATFYVYHDMEGSNATTTIDIIDPMGRVMASREWNQPLGYSPSVYSWQITGMSTGLYLYRVRVSCNGSSFVSQTKKLILAQ